MCCVFRAIGVDFDVDSFLAQSSLRPYQFWHKGELELRKRALQNSGFSLDVSEAEMDDPKQQVVDAIAFLKANVHELKKLQSFPNVEKSLLDFGINDRDVAVQVDHFPAELLLLAGSLNIDLTVSRYPMPHEEDQTISG